MNVQRDYADTFPEARDIDQRRRKAHKILTAIQSTWRDSDLRGIRLLDIGCSIGVTSDAFARAGARVKGLDIDISALDDAPRPSTNPIDYLVADAGAVPFAEGTFDILVCSQVYEHYPDLNRLVSEIYRLLSPTGICFFSGPNKLAIVEEHYFLPFLSWLPKQWADRYVQIFGAADEYYEMPRTSRQLKRALSGFKITDLTREMLTHPDVYQLEDRVPMPLSATLRAMPKFIWPLIEAMVPNFNWILKKD